MYEGSGQIILQVKGRATAVGLTSGVMGAMRGAWRIRVGDYRVVYDVDDAQQLVVILAVLHRREVYRR